VAVRPFSDVHGAALDVGPQTKKVTVPVGEPFVAVPVTVTASLSLLPSGTVGLLTADVIAGLVGWAPLAPAPLLVAASTRPTDASTAMPRTLDRRRKGITDTFLPVGRLR